MKLSKVILISLMALLVVSSGVAFYLSHRIESQTASEPWQALFYTDPSARPALMITHPGFKISSQNLRFSDQKLKSPNMVRLVVFDRAQVALPFGECLSFEGGSQTVKLNLFGHEVVLAPKELTIDRESFPWKSNQSLAITGAGVLSPPGSKTAPPGATNRSTVRPGKP